jgi:hypothetical protein
MAILLRTTVTDQIKLAFAFAQDTTKQLLTLATGIIAVSITFAKDFVKEVPPGATPWAIAAWGCLLASVLFGLWALLALTGSLEPTGRPTAAVSIRGWNVRLPAALQILAFFGGLLLTVVFGVRSL